MKPSFIHNGNFDTGMQHKDHYKDRASVDLPHFMMIYIAILLVSIA